MQLLLVTLLNLLFSIQTRRVLLSEPAQNRAISPNLTWLCLVPFVNAILPPFIVYSLNKTVARGERRNLYLGDRVLKFTSDVIIEGCIFLLFYGFYLGVIGKNINLLTGIDAYAIIAVSVAYAVAIIWYPIRLRKLFIQNEKGGARREQAERQAAGDSSSSHFGRNARQKESEADERERQRRQEGFGRRRDAPTSRMSIAQALEVLGLKAGATEQEIRAAYCNLMKRVHPDLGGSTFFSTQLNEARDVLLGNFRACA